MGDWLGQEYLREFVANEIRSSRTIRLRACSLAMWHAPFQRRPETVNAGQVNRARTITGTVLIR